MAMLTAKIKIENFKEKMTKILNFELQMSYIRGRSQTTFTTRMGGWGQQNVNFT